MLILEAIFLPLAPWLEVGLLIHVNHILNPKGFPPCHQPTTWKAYTKKLIEIHSKGADLHAVKPRAKEGSTVKEAPREARHVLCP